MGHKKKTTKLKENPTGHQLKNISASARNLRKTDLGSIIFGCKHSTFKEYIFKQLFGLPKTHYAYVRNVRPGLPLFLFNYSDRRLHGIFEAQSEGRMNINQYAWTFESDEATQFPAQVKVKIKQQCQPLTEDQFRPIIAENYYERSHFWFELDKSQTRQIIDLFMKSTVPRSHWMSQDTAMLDTAGSRDIKSIERDASSFHTSSEGPTHALVCHVQKELLASSPAKSWSSLFRNPPEYKAIKKQEITSSSNMCNTESEVTNYTCPSKLDMEWDSMYCSDGENMEHGNQRHDLCEDEGCEKVADSGGMHVDGSEESFESMMHGDQTHDFCEDERCENVANSGDMHVDGSGGSFERNSGLNTFSEGHALVSHVQKELTTSPPAKPLSSLFKDPLLSKEIKKEEIACSSNLCNTETEVSNYTCPSKFDMDWESIYCSNGENMVHQDQTLDSNKDQWREKVANSGSMHVDDSEGSFESSMASDDDNKAIILDNSSHQSNTEWGFSNNDKQKKHNEAKALVSLSDGAIDLSSLMKEIILKMTLSDLRSFALKILDANEKMKTSQLVQDQKIHTLKQEQVQPKAVSEGLKEKFRVHESSCCHSVGLADEQVTASLDISSNRQSILLVGGYDGSLFMPTLEVFVPSLDNVRSLKSMGTVRPYASSVQLNNSLYTLGGGDGKLWYDTVESYNSRNDCWVSCPSLSKKKGSLVGIGVDNKIFAMGGGDGIACFSDVEMLDLGFGKWISTPSMLQKRFAAAAAEVKGRLYAVGGYDGKSYLSSMEGFDPRESAWTMLQSMHNRRGCHAVTVLNEKLYAIGGYDYTGMFSSVEVFDPRFGSWMMAEPMNNARGYFGATTIGSNIYSIGGVAKCGQILASMECYSEGYGWQISDSTAVGKRSAFSAVAFAL